MTLVLLCYFLWVAVIRFNCGKFYNRNLCFVIIQQPFYIVTSTPIPMTIDTFAIFENMITIRIAIQDMRTFWT